MYEDIYDCICQNTKKEDLQSIMSNLQPNGCFEVEFQKVYQHTGGKWLIHDTKHHKDNQLQSLKLPCSIFKLSSEIWRKGVRWHHVESNILKEGPGGKTSWEIAERQMLFKTNTKGHKHLSIRLFIIEQDTIGKPKKTKSGIQYRNRALPQISPIDCGGVQLHQYWTTLLVYV